MFFVWVDVDVVIWTRWQADGGAENDNDDYGDDDGDDTDDDDDAFVIDSWRRWRHRDPSLIIHDLLLCFLLDCQLQTTLDWKLLTWPPVPNLLPRYIAYFEVQAQHLF